MGKIDEDPRIDPRIKALMGSLAEPTMGDVSDREHLLKEASTPEAMAMNEQMTAMLDLIDDETIAPSAGLDIRTIEIASQPDGNTIKIQFIRPQSDEPLPCVYYIHGGGMASMSCYLGMYRSWGRLIANQGVAVAMVDFRNCVTPSSVPEVEPFPAGLNDCVSGLKWVHAHAGELGIDADHVIVAGESGGGNLTLATGLRLRARRRPRPDPGAVRDVPVHRGQLAPGPVPVVDREQRHPARPAQQQRGHRLRHRGVRGEGPAGVAVVRHRGRRVRPGPHRHQRQRVRPACATRASSSTGCCCEPGCRPGAVR